MYSSYITTYIDRDVKELSGSVDSLVFYGFFAAAAELIVRELRGGREA